MTKLCKENGLAVTPQRRLIWEAMHDIDGHPSVEDVYSEVRKEMPSISLATVYNNVRQFVECGMLREVSLHHGSSRLETNTERHFHAVCMSCRSIQDVPFEFITGLYTQGELPDFSLSGVTVEFHGLCQPCRDKEAEAKQDQKLRPRRGIHEIEVQDKEGDLNDAWS